MSSLKTALGLTLSLFAASFADVTGDFKLNSATYTNNGDKFGGDVTVAGTVNHGAIQSGKSVVVNVSYDYSFAYEIITTTTVETPARCPNAADPACANKCPQPNGNFHQFCDPTYVTTTTTVINTSTAGLTAITEPTVEKGRLNPKGKITGYNWTAVKSIAATDDIVDPELIPEGATLVPGSVEITGVSYTAHLQDKMGYVFPDTQVSGVLFGE